MSKNSPSAIETENREDIELEISDQFNNFYTKNLPLFEKRYQLWVEKEGRVSRVEGAYEKMLQNLDSERFQKEVKRYA